MVDNGTNILLYNLEDYDVAKEDADAAAQVYIEQENATIETDPLAFASREGFEVDPNVDQSYALTILSDVLNKMQASTREGRSQESDQEDDDLQSEDESVMLVSREESDARSKRETHPDDADHSHHDHDDYEIESSKLPMEHRALDDDLPMEHRGMDHDHHDHAHHPSHNFGINIYPALYLMAILGGLSSYFSRLLVQY